MEINRLIQDNFGSIKLEEGIGFFQAKAIDNLIIDEENGKKKFQIEVNKDKLYGKDWNKLIEYLTENEIDLFPFSFMDEKGIRFILPVLIILEFKNELNSLLYDIISRPKSWNKNIWNDLLNEKQRNIIIKIYEHWNEGNLDLLRSYGMSEFNVINENKKNDVYRTLRILK